MRVTARDWVDNLRESKAIGLGLNKRAKGIHSSEDWVPEGDIIIGTKTLMENVLREQTQGLSIGDVKMETSEMRDPDTGEIAGYRVTLDFSVDGNIETSNGKPTIKKLDESDTEGVMLYAMFLFDGKHRYFLTSCEDYTTSSLTFKIQKNGILLCPRVGTTAKESRVKDYLSVKDFYDLYTRVFAVHDDLLPDRSSQYIWWWQCPEEHIEEALKDACKVFLGKAEILSATHNQIDFINKNFK